MFQRLAGRVATNPSPWLGKSLYGPPGAFWRDSSGKGRTASDAVQLAKRWAHLEALSGIMVVE